MRGIELAKGYFEDFGKPTLERDFAGLLPYVAAAFTGSGSERYGYDDEVSRDHDFEPGFSLFIPGEDVVDRRTEFLLQRAYDKLPREYNGFARSVQSPVGGRRNGVVRTAEYFADKVGSPTGELSLERWVTIPDAFLSEATNGVVFFDGYGELTAIRARLSQMPEDARKKRIAGNLIVMAQAGLYNYARCLAHGEHEGAQLALNDFVTGAAKAFFLLNKSYMPFYKWSFRAMRDIQGGKEFAEKLSQLLCGELYDNEACQKKAAAVGDVCADITSMLIEQRMTDSNDSDLERQAYIVNDGIKSAALRNMSIFAAV